jgi:hypothetical protein
VFQANFKLFSNSLTRAITSKCEGQITIFMRWPSCRVCEKINIQEKLPSIEITSQPAFQMPLPDSMTQDFRSCQALHGWNLFPVALVPLPCHGGPTGRTAASTPLKPPALQRSHCIERVAMQRHPCLLGLRFGRRKLACLARVEFFLHRTKASPELTAQGDDGPIHLRLQPRCRFATAALELDRMGDPFTLGLPPVCRTHLTVTGQHPLRLKSLGCKRNPDAGPWIDLEGPNGPLRTFDDRGIDDGAATAGTLQAPACELHAHMAQQKRVDLGHRQPVAKSAMVVQVWKSDGCGLGVGEHHEDRPDLQGVRELNDRRVMPSSQQHQLDHRYGCAVLRPTSIAGPPLYRSLSLPTPGKLCGSPMLKMIFQK